MLIFILRFCTCMLAWGMARAISLSHILFPQASALTKSVVIFIFIRILTEIILIRGIVKAILSKIADKGYRKTRLDYKMELGT